MLGKRKPFVQFFDIHNISISDNEFPVFLSSVFNTAREVGILQAIVKFNPQLDKGYVERKIRGFSELIRLESEKIEIDFLPDLDGMLGKALSIVIFNIRIKRRFLFFYF